MLKAHFNTISKMPNYARKYSWSLTNVTCLQFVQKQVTMNERVLKWFLFVRWYTCATSNGAFVFSFINNILNIWIKLQHWFTSEIFFFILCLLVILRIYKSPIPTSNPRQYDHFFFIEHEIRSGCNSSEQCLFKKYQNKN